MKKRRVLWLAVLAAGIAFISGCSGGKTSPQDPSDRGAQSPGASPTPVPTPMPYELLLRDSPTVFGFLENTDQVRSCLDTLTENAQRRAEETGETAASIASVKLSDGRTGEDIMAVDGDILYVLSDKNLVILRLDGEDSRVISNTRVGTDWTGQESEGLISGSEEIPTGLCCAGDRLAVFYDCYSYEGASGELEYTEYTTLEIFDVSDPGSPGSLARFGQDGAFRAVSLGEGTLLLATEYAVFPGEESGEDLIPHTYYNEAPSALEAGNICYAQDGHYAGYSVVGAYTLSAPAMVDVKALLGVDADVLAGDGQLYFHSDRRAEVRSRAFEGFTENARISCTDIFRFALGENGLTVTAGVVNGVLPDSGCMDVRGGTLRLLTVRHEQLYPVEGGDQPYALEEELTGADIILMDDMLSPAGKVSLGVNGTDIRWVGFLGDSAIVSLTDGKRSLPVTFSDPAAPAVGEDLPEYVTALAIRPWGENGFTAFSQEEAGELTLTVYDAGFNALARRGFGSDFSSTLENTRGYLSNGEENLIGFSADDSYCLYGYTPGEGIVFWADAFLQDWAWNARGFCVEDRVYVADKRELCVASGEDLSTFFRIPY